MTGRLEPRTALPRARIAVSALFVTYGLAVSSWAVHIPAVQDRTGVSTAMLGTMLLLLGAGALAGMQLAGPLIGRIGAPLLGVVGGLTASAALAVPLTATNPVVLGTGLFIFGATGGLLDIAMNAHAVYVERRYGRAVMSSFHGAFSIGNIAGAASGTALIALGAGPITSALVATLGCATLILVSSPWLLRGPHAEPGTRRESCQLAHDAVPTRASDKLRRVLTLGTLAFLYFVCEGAATDWSGLHARQHLGADGTASAVTFAVFVTTMTIGRFTADRLTDALGAFRLLRAGTVLAIAGITVVLVSPYLPLTYVGWAVYGLGLAGCVPLVFSATGSLPGSTATDLSRVVGMAYVAMLAGPSVIGWATRVVPLSAAMGIPLIALGICLTMSRAIRQPSTAPPAVPQRTGSSPTGAGR
ncbi:hypothetical protein BTO20_06280 [Mycobacterium dioxanotrophicus]|jgi:predicted MFS family arabinose efflux permease|uniref:MFS transporter n=1 Tax=Mycobacterium dioxanotrophicus TaxID=482462 RepID=A0A1Y0BZE5_9MYCO|nr:MFS transporter [Mycobacterium dioxanotrophicus]ART68246.1 hypothetical protein BTO20_06280 [Mycobacterium dioxanotrophicus]